MKPSNGRERLRLILIAADQLLNTLTGGWPDETLSSRIHRRAVLAAQSRRRWRIARRLANALFFTQRDHCQSAYERERTRSHLPPEMREGRLKKESGTKR